MAFSHTTSFQMHKSHLVRLHNSGARQHPASLPRLGLPKSPKGCKPAILLGYRCPATRIHFKNTPGIGPCSPGFRDEYLESLPSLPKKATILSLIPFLTKLAFTEKKFHWRLWLVSLLVVASKVTGLLSPVLLKYAVEAITVSNLRLAVAFLGLAGLARFLSGATKEIQLPLFTPVAQAATRRLAGNTFAHILDLDVQYHLDRQSGTLSKILDRGTRSIQMMYRIIFFTFIPTTLELLFVTYFMGTRFGPLVSLAVISTFVGFVSWTVLLAGMASKVRREVNRFDNLTTARTIDVLQNIETVMLFGNNQFEVTKYDKFLAGYQHACVESEKTLAWMNLGQHFILSAGLSSVLVLTTLFGTGGAVTAGSLVMAQGMVLQLWAPLQFVGFFYREMRQSLVDIEEYLCVLQEKSSLREGELCMLPPEEEYTLEPFKSFDEEVGQELKFATPDSPIGVQVDIRNVHFGYTGERPILKGINLSIKPGQSVALVGGSGSGKSTLLKLLGRLYDVEQGSIDFDGVDIRSINVNSVRSVIGAVPQDTVLFNDSLMENIRYGRPGASDAEVYRASEMAQLHLAISRMPEGYGTLVGDRGLKLSGGEMQRVAIARTFLRGPRLLLCDEATSALDSGTEKNIMASIADLARGRTSVFIAHRLSTIQNCDVIVVMSEGQIAEQGSHHELMQAKGIYAQMWSAQARGEVKSRRKMNPVEISTSF